MLWRSQSRLECVAANSLTRIASVAQWPYSSDMITIQQLKQAVRRLPPNDLVVFRNWFAEFDAEVWDRQIEDDVSAGRPDVFIEEALRDSREGRCMDL
jgi:hypothetical protein